MQSTIQLQMVILRAQALFIILGTTISMSVQFLKSVRWLNHMITTKVSQFSVSEVSQDIWVSMESIIALQLMAILRTLKYQVEFNRFWLCIDTHYLKLVLVVQHTSLLYSISFISMSWPREDPAHTTFYYC